MLPIFGTECPQCEKMLQFPLSFSPPPSSTNHNRPLSVQPASSSLLLGSPPPIVSLSHESRLSKRSFFLSDLCWLVGFFSGSATSGTCMTPASLVPHVSCQRDCVDVWVSNNSISPWMQLWSGVFRLDGSLRPWLAAPEVEEEEEQEERGCQSRSASRLSGLCWLGVLLSAPWSFTEPTPQPSSVAHLPLAVPQPHIFSPNSPTSHITACYFCFIISCHWLPPEYVNSTVSTLSSLYTFTEDYMLCCWEDWGENVWVVKSTADLDESPIKLASPSCVTMLAALLVHFSSCTPNNCACTRTFI